jgi:hypothetical protein
VPERKSFVDDHNLITLGEVYLSCARGEHRCTWSGPTSHFRSLAVSHPTLRPGPCDAAFFVRSERYRHRKKKGRQFGVESDGPR